VAREIEVSAVDPFDLPEWLGTMPVTWVATSSVRGGHHVAGALTADGHSVPCDLLAVDEAHPQPVLGDSWRQQVHQAWSYEQVLLVTYDGRLTVAVPGTSFTADRVLDVVGRLAKAVGVPPSAFAVTLRL
jgi:hypothetical protein